MTVYSESQLGAIHRDSAFCATLVGYWGHGGRLGMTERGTPTVLVVHDSDSGVEFWRVSRGTFGAALSHLAQYLKPGQTFVRVGRGEYAVEEESQ